MVSVTLAIPDEIKSEMKELSWVNWSELTKKELSKEIERMAILKKIMAITTNSKFTEKDAEILSEKVKKSIHNKLKKEGII